MEIFYFQNLVATYWILILPYQFSDAGVLRRWITTLKALVAQTMRTSTNILVTTIQPHPQSTEPRKLAVIPRMAKRPEALSNWRMEVAQIMPITTAHILHFDGTYTSTNADNLFRSLLLRANLKKIAKRPWAVDNKEVLSKLFLSSKQVCHQQEHSQTGQIRNTQRFWQEFGQKDTVRLRENKTSSTVQCEQGFESNFFVSKMRR